MNIALNIHNQNNSENETNQLLIEQFKHFNIEIYGTFEEPLFKANDIGDMLGLKNVKEIIKKYNSKQKLGVCLTDPHGRLQETNMLTEQGLYKILMRSRKPIAEEFQDWVCELIKQIRLNSNNTLKNRIKELEFYKEPSYQELPLEETVYCFSTDIENVYKIGKTTTKSSTRKSDTQTPCVLDIQILYEVKTIDCDILEKLVHYSLNKYRISKREHFSSRLEHIKFVMDKCAKFVNTIGCVRQNITEKEFTKKLGNSIIQDKVVEKVVEKVVKVYKNKHKHKYYEKIQLPNSDFDLDEFLKPLEPKILIEELN
jgi:prophage antirepressor-like protein